MRDTEKTRGGEERTIVRDLSWCGVGAGANAAMVDAKDGKIVRIRPARYYDRYSRDEVKPWVMHARGKTFEPSEKSLIPPISLAYKKRVYSPARIRFPMKRVDFDPSGAPGSKGAGGRNIQNRGVSKYVRISWDEALDIVTGELQRMKQTYGPSAILYQSDQHGENKVVHGPHGCGRKLLRLFGGYTLQVRQPDSWEGWWWGAKHVWGCEPVGQQVPQKNLLWDISKNSELLLFWGCDQETTTWGWGGQLPSRFSSWWTELGIRQIYIAPDCNYAAAVHADKWIPILPNTDAALYLAIAYEWFKNGTYDKEYLATQAYGVDKFEAYVMGAEDGAAKSPEWAAPITGVPARTIKALAAEWASKRTTVVIGNGNFIWALRHPDIEFIFCQHPWLENDALFADLLLPANTKLEEDDIANDVFGGQMNLLFPETRCIEPLGESFSDYEIVCKIAERLGLLEEYTGGRTIPELIRQGHEDSGAAHLISWEDLNEKGYFVMPPRPDWETIPAGLIEFYEDPQKHPLSTPTGKIEFYATGLAQHFPRDDERGPVPKWIAKGETHEETLGTERSEKYPLLVMSNHPRWGVHSQHDDVTWLREIATCKVMGPGGYQYHPLWMNPADAGARGIKAGDVVSIFNERGAVLAGAYITERIMPGVVSMDHGAKYDPIVPGEIDRGGVINTIVPRNTTSRNACGMVVSGFLAEVEKADLGDLERKYPEAFARECHPAAGPCLAGVLMERSRG